MRPRVETPSPATERKRRQRDRKRLDQLRRERNIVTAKADILKHEREGMVVRGWLTAGSENDPAAVREALHKALAWLFP